eukprot:TRINITY_DN11158_c0_g1_i2.p1 TRINITY_DN11158_c0_g1~~TRINITY_DN11158_c0_g1_i2.p1  ORF type:complete len:351 (+),score=42.82 TRINITY_DN11158_c0_g1_i2:61-1113(+)
MSVALHVVLPSSQVLCIDAAGHDTTEALKARIAKMAKLKTTKFSLSFDGRELGDGKISQFPFEDQSTLEVSLSKAASALYKLTEMGWGGKIPSDIVERIVDDDSVQEHSATYGEVLRLMADADLCKSRRKSMSELLVVAAGRGLLQCVASALDTGVNVNVRPATCFHNTALQFACGGGFEDVVQLLLRYGADPDMPDRDREGTPLYVAAKERNLSVVKILLENGANPDVTLMNGDSSLMLAARCEDHELVHLLLSYKSDPSIKGVDGRTPLHLAADKNCMQILTLLLEHGSKVNAKNNQGETPLHHAAFSGCKDTLAHLLGCGADTTVKNKAGMQLLIVAFHRRDTGRLC